MPQLLQVLIRAAVEAACLKDSEFLNRLNAVYDALVANASSFPAPFDLSAFKDAIEAAARGERRNDALQGLRVLQNMLPKADAFVDTGATLSTTPKRTRGIHIPALVSRNKRGGRYVRPAHVKAELARLHTADPSSWCAQCAELANETLVCLSRLTQDDIPEVSGSLVSELTKRVKGRARSFPPSIRVYLRKFDMEQWISDVEMHVMDLVLTKEDSRTRDFLEVRFGLVLKKMIAKLWAQHAESFGDIVEIRHWKDKSPDDGSKIRQDQLEQVEDPRICHGEELLNLDMEIRWHRKLRKALKAVENAKHRKAAILHHGRGIKIARKSGKNCLAEQFNEHPDEIRGWCRKAMRQMRKAMNQMGVHSAAEVYSN